MPLGNEGRVERPRKPNRHAIVRLVHLGRVAGLDPEHLGAVDETFRPQEADGELVLVAGRPHRDGDGDRRLTWAGGADLEHPLLVVVPADRDHGQARPFDLEPAGLERLFADDTIRAVLESGSPDRHDPGRRDVARRGSEVGHRRQFRSVPRAGSFGPPRPKDASSDDVDRAASHAD